MSRSLTEQDQTPIGQGKGGGGGGGGGSKKKASPMKPECSGAQEATGNLDLF